MDHPSLHLSYDLLKKITNDFSKEIGRGSYGRVYKGVHKDGRTIAVKLLHDMPALDDEQFRREFNNLTSLEHDNIVRLVGYCDEAKQECAEYEGRIVVADRIHRALCFEYAHNGSLQDNLSDEFNGHDWRTRYVIIKGICNGLKYLHQELEPPMHHFDLKPANILLDENMFPKIADFGLSRLFGEEHTRITKNSVGTCGYLPPEFIEKNIISSKFDIFSLGVVVIKVMAGPRGYTRYVDMPSLEFVKLVHKNWRARLQGTLLYALEPYYEQVKTCIEIALRCVEADRHKRPTIRDIVDQMNETEINIRLSSPIEVLSQKDIMPRHIPYDLLNGITDGFSEERKLGSGTYGITYKGVHKNGEVIAVKLLYDMPALDDDQFRREFNNLTRLEHDNIVSLVGYCSETRTEVHEYNGRIIVADRIYRALCFECAHNGSLLENLFDEFNGHDWRTRYVIIKGICNGLKYLHQELKPPMLHLDLKPGNILLDENMFPKIADFGLSRLFGEEHTRITKNSVGTCGYLPPEFIEKNIISSKFDIFSLGVVVIKVMAGPRGYTRYVDMPSLEFVKLVHKNWRARLQGTLLYALEPYYEQVKTCIEIALRCVEADRHKRPTIRDIVDKMNETEINIRLSSPIEVLSQQDIMPRHIPYDLLNEITDGFSEERKLGSGGYGKTYKGVHKNGEMIAVKLLYDMPGLDNEQFKRECINLWSIQHDNLVSLVGYGCETRREVLKYKGRIVVADRRALCFEYAHNGSLQENLFDEFNGHDWRTRYVIIKGICNGLKYLHQELKPPMHHLDLKPANILLDENMFPKITDFGLSRLFGEEHTKITKNSIGTCGYVPPEYIENGLISNKFDVFSLGVVIIKVMAGAEGYSRCAEMSSQEFVELVQGNWKDRLQGTSVYDTEPEVYYEQVKTCIKLALRCVEADMHKRPGIMDIVDKMNEIETKIRLWIPQKAQSFSSAITGLGRFEYSDLADATDRFSKDNQIGEGDFANVYKGSYIDKNGNQEVAVKKMKDATGDFGDFIVVLQTICEKRHINLVELKGWCYSRTIQNSIDSMGWFSQQKGKLCIVYELVPNGNLEDHLHYREKILSWENRYQIVKDIGCALHYLHHECYLPILHRNIMPSNILLDYDFNAKLSGFRLSKITSQNNTTAETTGTGKMSYMDPQFMKHGEVEFNCKTDVYSFGIVILEIACTGKSREEVRELYRHRAAEPEVMEDAADPKLGGDFDRMELERVIVLGLRCSHRDSEQRPSMVDAMKFLMEGIELPALAL